MTNEFNFARAPFENERLPRLVFAVAAAAVLGLTLVHGFFLARYLVREQEALDLKVNELRSAIEAADADIARTRASLAQKQTELGNERTRFLTRIYRHKSFSWTGLFNELEQITPAAVRITSIAPFEEDGEIAVTINLVGRTLTNVLEMVRALEDSSLFATVFPLDEVDLAELGGGESGIAATLRLRYVEPGPGETEPNESNVAEEDAEGDGASVEEPPPEDDARPDGLVEDDAPPGEPPPGAGP